MKTTTQKNPFYYHDLIYHIKTQSWSIPKIKNKTKTIYKNILQIGSKDSVTVGETLWKNKLPNLDFSKICKNTYWSHSQPHTSDLLYKLLNHAIKINQYT